jgi:hypothetical protein
MEQGLDVSNLIQVSRRDRALLQPARNKDEQAEQGPQHSEGCSRIRSD